MPYLRQNSLRGDHYVTFFVKVPERLSKEQKEALLAFDEAMGGKHGGGRKKKNLFK